MKRNEHIFHFSGAAIGAAAQAESDYHKDRVRWWKQEQEIMIEKARQSGVNVTEYQNTGGKGVSVNIDPTITNRVQECANKINSHQNAADKFQIEAAAYQTKGNEDRIYELHPDDIVYFRLAGGDRVS